MYIFSNLATSIDGKIATRGRGHFPLGTDADRKQMQVLRRRAQAVVMGASSLRAFRRPILIPGGKKQIINIVVSTNLAGISPAWDFFKEPTVRRILFLSRKPPAARLKAFEKTSEIVFLSAGRPAAPQIVKVLEARGIKKLLVEGGGGVMWDFLRADLLDELNVTVTPWVLGGADAPTLVDGRGFSPNEALKFRLKSCRRLKDEVYLVYRKRY